MKKCITLVFLAQFGLLMAPFTDIGLTPGELTGPGRTGYAGEDSRNGSDMDEEGLHGQRQASQYGQQFQRTNNNSSTPNTGPLEQSGSDGEDDQQQLLKGRGVNNRVAQSQSTLVLPEAPILSVEKQLPVAEQIKEQSLQALAIRLDGVRMGIQKQKDPGFFTRAMNKLFGSSTYADAYTSIVRQMQNTITSQMNTLLEQSLTDDLTSVQLQKLSNFQDDIQTLQTQIANLEKSVSDASLGAQTRSDFKIIVKNVKASLKTAVDQATLIQRIAADSATSNNFLFVASKDLTNPKNLPFSTSMLDQKAVTNVMAVVAGEIASVRAVIEEDMNKYGKNLDTRFYLKTPNFLQEGTTAYAQRMATLILRAFNSKQLTQGNFAATSLHAVLDAMVKQADTINSLDDLRVITEKLDEESPDVYTQLQRVVLEQRQAVLEGESLDQLKRQLGELGISLPGDADSGNASDEE